MSLIAGTKLGPYEVVAPIGAGGMGEVYRARDTRLDRTVAIKVLPPSLARDPQFRDRFEREARAISSLQHPHICALFDVGEADVTGAPDSGTASDTIRFLVLEYLEGETIANRLARAGAIPLPEALKIAGEICDALHRAHRSHIVHRDLKPANVMLTKSGAKLLDFGLAKTAAPVVASGLSMMPTTPPELTQQGAILGTFQYMAPEQIEGLDADERSDIFAVGALLFEMLTARPAFTGATRASLLGSILKDEPPAVSSLVPSTPRAIDRVIAICLAKDADDRYQSTRDLLRDLRSAGSTAQDGAPTTPTTLRAPAISGRGWLMVGAVGIVTALVGGGVVRQWLAPGATPPAELVQFTIQAPPNTTFTTPIGGGTGITAQLAVSPDGKLIVFVASDTGGGRLWLRPLGSVESQVIPGTEGASYPFWSPDSRTVAFFAAGRLKKVSVDGGPPTTLCEATSGRGGAWSRDNVILFAPNLNSPLLRVSAAGGNPEAASAFDETYGESSHRFPAFLPDGRHFVFTASVGICCPAAKPARVMIGELDSMQTTLLMQVESTVSYSADHVFFNRTDGDNTLMAQPFDAVARRLAGDPFPIAERIASEGSRYVSFSASNTGVAAFARGTGDITARLTWIDRTGKVLATLGETAVSSVFGMSLSANDRRVAISRITDGAVNGNSDLYIVDAQQDSASRFTFDPGEDSAPVWSPDESEIVFRGIRNGRQRLLRRRVRGAEGEELLFDNAPGTGAGARTPTDWSQDKKYILFTQQGVGGASDIWSFPLSGDGKPFAVTQTPEAESQAVFSPNGRWIAYVSNDPGGTQTQVFVQPFPATGIKFQVSQNSGQQPAWSRDGRELFFISSANSAPRLMAVPVRTDPDFEPGTPVSLFSLSPGTTTGTAFATNNQRAFAVSKNGQRFLFSVVRRQDTTTPLTVVLNWLALRK